MNRSAPAGAQGHGEAPASRRRDSVRARLHAWCTRLTGVVGGGSLAWAARCWSRAYRSLGDGWIFQVLTFGGARLVGGEHPVACRRRRGEVCRTLRARAAAVIAPPRVGACHASRWITGRDVRRHFRACALARRRSRRAICPHDPRFRSPRRPSLVPPRLLTRLPSSAVGSARGRPRAAVFARAQPRRAGSSRNGSRAGPGDRSPVRHECIPSGAMDVLHRVASVTLRSTVFHRDPGSDAILCCKGRSLSSSSATSALLFSRCTPSIHRSPARVHEHTFDGLPAPTRAQWTPHRTPLARSWRSVHDYGLGALLESVTALRTFTSRAYRVYPGVELCAGRARRISSPRVIQGRGLTARWGAGHVGWPNRSTHRHFRDTIATARPEPVLLRSSGFVRARAAVFAGFAHDCFGPARGTDCCGFGPFSREISPPAPHVVLVTSPLRDIRHWRAEPWAPAPWSRGHPPQGNPPAVQPGGLWCHQ